MQHTAYNKINRIISREPMQKVEDEEEEEKSYADEMKKL